MDIGRNGLRVTIDAAGQPDEWLISAAQEIAEAAKARGLVLPAFAGAVAVESTTDVKTSPTDTKEALVAQLDAAFRGYQNIAKQLNADREPEEQLHPADLESVAEEFTIWLTQDKLDYVRQAMEADPELRFTVIASPNITASADELIKLAETFGKEQPYSTSMWSKIVKRYSSEELSGTDPANGNQVQFGLVPNKFNPDLYGTVAQQRANLVKLQANTPDLRVPSFLEDMTLWQTLRAQGDSLSEGGVFDRTYVRHFDLADKRVDAYDYVLRSYVFGNGQPYVFGSFVHGGYAGRVLVG